MLTLSGNVISVHEEVGDRQQFVLSTNPHLPLALRANKAFLIKENEVPPAGFKHYLAFGRRPECLPADFPCTVLKSEFEYLSDKDVISIGCDGHIRTLFRASSSHNSILLTEQCNNYCLMCSQPPKRIDDRWLLNEAKETVRLIPRETRSIGITGGEPTLLGDDFVDLLHLMKNWLPHASIHILSNGRAFADPVFAKKIAAIKHQDLMIGIPIYSSDPSKHDYVVQAKGAFDETVRGILNLKQLGQKVEVRVVIHKQTYEGLPALSEFIARNLLFVDHVALMGLEMTGFTRANLEALWIDPADYRNHLSLAVHMLNSYGIRTSVYNHQLCLINPDVEPYYVHSISDWKNEYAQECGMCSRKLQCGGFFSSGIKYGYSSSITPFQ